jgi:hypothetical protein
LFEGQDHEHPVHIADDGMHAALLPGPDLRADVVNDLDAAQLPHMPGDAQVEARIIDQDHGVGLERLKIGLAPAHVPQDGAEVEDHLREAHERKVAVVLHDLGTRLGHAVAAPGPDHQLLPVLHRARLQRLDQVAAVEVAARLAGNDVDALRHHT